MRTIKFRAWDKANKHFIWSLNPEAGPNYPIWNTDFWRRVESDPDNYDPMQFTGLLDNNGKEIWEGDILAAEDGRLSSIEYDAPHFIVRHHPEGGSDFIAAKNKFEVIGNIYENPELLK